MFSTSSEVSASKWLDKVNFDIQSQLEFKSAGAELNVKSVRIYNKALTSDEVLNNYIVAVSYTHLTPATRLSSTPACSR